MAQQKKGGFCKKCDKDVVVFRKGTSHVLHLLLTIMFGWLTAPLFFIGALVWLVIWILLSIKIGGWRCDACGSAKVTT